MKKRVCLFLLTMSLIVSVSATASVYAQTGQTFSINIPFDFQIGDKLLKSGRYSVVNLESGVMVRSADGRQCRIVLTNHIQGKASRPESAGLSFHKYQDQYFLSTVWNQGRQGKQLLQSRRERRLRKELSLAANATQQVEEVILVATR